jgi:hypothetical protein
MTNPLSAFGRPYTFTKTNPTVKIDVKPLPPGQPPSFNGAVGQFRMTANIDKKQVFANEPFSLKVKVEGRGNAKQVELPALDLPQEFETFDTKSDSKFFKDGTSYKEFEVLIIPRKEGRLTIPSIKLSFFNPSTQKYETVQTQPIEVVVGAGKNLNLSVSNPLDLTGEIRQERKLVLPSPVLEVSNAFWSPRLSQISYIVSTGLFLFLLGFVMFKEFKSWSPREALIKELNARFKTIHQLQKKSNYKDAGIQVMNLLDYCLVKITQQQESSSLDVLISKVPPSLQKYFDTDFKKSVQYFETLGFAPEEISKHLMDSSSFDKHIKVVKKSVLEAVQASELS